MAPVDADTVARRVRRVFALLVLVGVALLGCDAAGSKRASLYERLTGTWTVERLQGGGSFEFDYTNRVDERYDWVRFDFRSGDNERTYRMRTRPVGDTARVVAEGSVVLRGDRLLIMVNGFTEPDGLETPVTWTYQFEASRAIFRLPANQQNGSRAFLSTLLPATGWSESEGVRLQLAPTGE